jgi:hypothetical protein
MSGNSKLWPLSNQTRHGCRRISLAKYGEEVSWDFA